VRAKIENGELKNILEPAYHGDPVRAEGALVFVDYGQDLKAMLEELGFKMELYEHRYPTPKGGYNVVFCAQKPA
jgi:hypothetical protein